MKTNMQTRMNLNKRVTLERKNIEIITISNYSILQRKVNPVKA
jgi:hypothetical protein